MNGSTTRESRLDEDITNVKSHKLGIPSVIANQAYIKFSINTLDF